MNSCSALGKLTCWAQWADAIVLCWRSCSIWVTPWPCSAAEAVNCSSVTQPARIKWTGQTAAAGSLCGEWGCGSVVRIRGLMRTQHFRIRTSLVCGVSDPRRLARICVCGSVQFGFSRNKFVQLLIRSRNSSGRFVRSLMSYFIYIRQYWML